MFSIFYGIMLLINLRFGEENMKTNIFVLCGGKSVEHEVSLTSASAIINAIDRDKYNVYPVFITKDGVWCSHGILEKEIESPQDLILETDSTVAESLVDFLTNYLKKMREM